MGHICSLVKYLMMVVFPGVSGYVLLDYSSTSFSTSVSRGYADVPFHGHPGGFRGSYERSTDYHGDSNPTTSTYTSSSSTTSSEESSTITSFTNRIQATLNQETESSLASTSSASTDHAIEGSHDVSLTSLETTTEPPNERSTDTSSQITSDSSGSFIIDLLSSFTSDVTQSLPGVTSNNWQEISRDTSVSILESSAGVFLNALSTDELAVSEPTTTIEPIRDSSVVISSTTNEPSTTGRYVTTVDERSTTILKRSTDYTTQTTTLLTRDTTLAAWDTATYSDNLPTTNLERLDSTKTMSSIASPTRVSLDSVTSTASSTTTSNEKWSTKLPGPISTTTAESKNPVGTNTPVYTDIETTDAYLTLTSKAAQLTTTLSADLSSSTDPKTTPVSSSSTHTSILEERFLSTTSPIWRMGRKSKSRQRVSLLINKLVNQVVSQNHYVGAVNPKVVIKTIKRGDAKTTLEGQGWIVNLLKHRLQ